MWDAPREARCIAKLLPMPFAPPVITQTDPAGLNVLYGGFGLLTCDIGTVVYIKRRSGTTVM